MILDANTVTGWRKPSKCDNSGPNCVELAEHGDQIALRNNSDAAGLALTFTRGEIGAFLEAAKSGEFDDLAG